MSVAANLDLNSLDSLSRTCRQIHEGVLQYRKMLLVSTLHCVNEHLPVDPEETLRFRARAGNWFYMEDTPGRTGYNGKSGQCARDLVSECRRCGTVVCRVCSGAQKEASTGCMLADVRVYLRTVPSSLLRPSFSATGIAAYVLPARRRRSATLSSPFSRQTLLSNVAT